MRAKNKKISDCILDVGILIHKHRVFSAFKGFLDAGIKVPHGDSVFKNLHIESRMNGAHIKQYAELIKKKSKKSYEKEFSGYIKNGIDPTKITEDFENIYADVRLIYNYSRRWDFFVRYAHTYQEYKEESEDYQIYYPSLGFEYTYDETTFLSLEVGPLVRDFEDRSVEYGYTVFADGRKSWLFQRANVDIFISNGLDYDYVSTQNLGLFYYTEAGGTAQYNIFRTFSANISGSYRYNAYVDLEPERYDNIYQAGVGLQWLVTYYCSLRLNYNYVDRQSNYEFEEYAENRVYLGVSFFPRSPYYWKR